MNTLKNSGNKTLEPKIRSRKGWIMLFALVLVVASLIAVVLPQIVRADAGGVKGHTFDFTFTKWATFQPDPSTMVGVLMAGVIGGDIGNGRYAGEVLSEDLSQEPDYWLANARYEFYGQDNYFVADVHVKQDETKGTAVITGVITQGWLKGAQVTGEYTVISECPIEPTGDVFGKLCFQGALHVQRPR